MKSGYFLNLPVSRSAQEPNITEKVRQNIVLCHVDWNLDERSWGFKWDLLVSCIAEHNRIGQLKLRSISGSEKQKIVLTS